jgi:phosphate-selective porin OprO/OprP
MSARKSHRGRAWLALLLLLSGLPSLAQEAAQDEEEASSSGVRFQFKKRPSLRFGNWLRIDFRAKFMTDFRIFSPDLNLDLFALRRARIGIEGNFLNKKFEYQVERELRQTSHPWRDVYVNFRHFRRVQIQGGKFKEPFGLEELTGSGKLDFTYRALISQYLTPARDIGVMAHGRFFKRGLNYQAGVFNQDGENARAKDQAITGERTLAARVWGTPLRLLRLPKPLKKVELGGAFTTCHLREGLNGLRGRSEAKSTFFPRISVRGRRQRLGTEMNWMHGPFSVKGEFMDVRDQRLGQGMRDEDLPDLISRGWYLSGTWVVTGEDKASGVEPRKNFILGRGLGAIELAGRYEQLRSGSSEHPGLPSRSTRAANILPNSDRAWTFGVNWYVHPFVKIQVNGIREKIEDIQRTPLGGHQRFWLAVCHLQFAM